MAKNLDKVREFVRNHKPEKRLVPRGGKGERISIPDEDMAAAEAAIDSSVRTGKKNGNAENAVSE